MSDMGQLSKYKFNVGVKNQWIARPQVGYTAAIVYVSGTGFTLTITGSSAPAAVAYPTLKAAKNAWRDFVRVRI